MNHWEFMKYIILLFFLLQLNFIYPQFYNSGQDPASLKWSQINTEHFQIIFPDETEAQAQYLANVLDSVYHKVSQSLGIYPKKVSVILHNQSTLSNGTTAWAPRRIDLLMTPPQSSYILNWLDQVAIHEFRHIVQIERINVGITKILSVLMGEMAVGGAAGTFMPQWYFEGDATDMETMMGRQGRGELPSFQMRLKAQLLEKGLYSYEKASHGSVKDYVPSEYHLGYAITSKLREEFGTSVWEKAIDESGKQPFAITPFSNSLKKNTGFTKQKLYRKTLEALKSDWEADNAKLNLTSSTQITKAAKSYTDYRHPIAFEDGKILAIKTSYSDIKRIVAIDKNGNEEIIFTPGPGLNESLSYANGLICWAEYQVDARWDHRDFSVLKIYDVERRKLINLTKKSRYFVPQISHDGKKIVTVEVDVKGNHALVILDAKGGTEIHRYQAPDKMIFITPSWSQDDSQIVLISMLSEKKMLSLYTLKSKVLKHFIPFNQYQISYPRFHGQWIYFTGSFTGIDNIYALNIETQKLSRITEVKYGTNDALIENGKLYYTAYSAGGFSLNSLQIDTSKWKEVKPKYLQASTNTAKIKYEVANTNYEVKKYSKSSGFFNFHSWAPFSLDPYNYTVKPGVSFMSQNLLSTATTTAGYEHNFREDVGRYYVKFSYEGWYPIIDVNFEHAKRRRYYLADTVNHVIEDFTFKETTFELGIRLALILNKNKHIQGIQPFVKFENIFLKMHPDSPFDFDRTSIQALHYGFTAYRQSLKSRFDIYPRWGQTIQFSYSMTPFLSPGWVGLTSFESAFYFPGLVKHHGLKIYAAFQHHKDGVYGFANRINHVRGLINRSDVDQYRISADYRLPLAYPDFDMGSFMYVKKIDLGLFYDYAYGESQDLINHYHSLGAELHSELHLLSFVAPIDFTLRGMYHPNLNKFGIEFIINIDFSSLY